MTTPQKEQKVASLVLEGIMIADGLLTLSSRITKWIQDKRVLGELTPEEEAALDEYLEKKFASWQKPTDSNPIPTA